MKNESKRRLTKEEKEKEKEMEKRKKVDKTIKSCMCLTGLGLIIWSIIKIFTEPSLDEKIRMSMEEAAEQTAEHFGYDYAIEYDENGTMHVNYYE